MREPKSINKMATTKNVITVMAMITALTFLMAVSGCKEDETTTPPPPRTTTYTLKVKDVLGVSGTATFTEISGTSTTVTIILTDAISGFHPAEICSNSAVEGGPVVITLNDVNATGKSITVVTSMTYSQLIAYDGFINIHKSATEPNIIIAQGDIGGNVITTTNKSYKLDTINSFGVSGTALFEKRVNGNTLVTITLLGAISGQSYPATINLGSISTVGGGPVVATLSNVDGTSGKSYTNIRKLDNGTAITYDNWLVYDGYINIYQTSVSLSNIICHGNIGSN